MDYLVFTTTGGRYRHLGSTDTGMRTACGRELDPARTFTETFGSVGVGCLVCQRSDMYRRAESLAAVA